MSWYKKRDDVKCPDGHVRYKTVHRCDTEQEFNGDFWVTSRACIDTIYRWEDGKWVFDHEESGVH